MFRRLVRVLTYESPTLGSSRENGRGWKNKAVKYKYLKADLNCMDLKEHFKPTALKLAVIGVLALLVVLYIVQVPSYMQAYGEWEYEQKVLSEQSLELTRAIEKGGSLTNEQILEKIQEKYDLNKNNIGYFNQFSSSASILNMVTQELIPLPLFPLACQNNRPYGCFDYMNKETFKKLLPTEEEINKMPGDAIFFGIITNAKSLREYKPFSLPKAILQTMGLAAIIYLLLSLLSLLFAWIDLRDTKQKAFVIGIGLFIMILPWIFNNFGIYSNSLILIFISTLAFLIILIIHIALKTQRRRTIFYWIILSLSVVAIIAGPIIGSYYADAYLQKRLFVSTPQEPTYIITACNDTNPIEGATKCINCGTECTDACKAEGKGRAATIAIKGENPRCACACVKPALITTISNNEV